MAYCGQCGLLLAPGNETCPRCGSVTEPELVLETPQAEASHTDDPTITSLPNPDAQRPAGPGTPPQQQKLVLRPDGSQGSFNEQAHTQNAPTRIMASPPPTPQIPNVRTPYHGFTPPVDIYNQPMLQQYSGADGGMLAQPRQRRRGGGRVLALLAALFVLLIALGAAVVLVMKPALLQGIIGNNVTSSETATTTPTEQARSVIRRYYDDINGHNYHDAYTLWAVDPQHPPGPYESFVNGFVGGAVTLLVGLGVWLGIAVALFLFNIGTNVSRTVADVSRMQQGFTARRPFSQFSEPGINNSKIVEGTVTDLEEERKKRRRE